MTTRQHLIEQDCMDKLGWAVDRVANSSDEEMISALFQFDRLSTSVIPIKPCPRTEKAPIVSSPMAVHSGDLSIIARIRDSIRLKTLCLSSDDLLIEDATFLQKSIVRDNQTLTDELNSIRDQLDKKRVTESKKFKIRNLLQKVVHSVGGAADMEHLKEVDLQIIVIKEDIKRLNEAIG